MIREGVCDFVASFVPSVREMVDAMERKRVKRHRLIHCDLKTLSKLWAGKENKRNVNRKRTRGSNSQIVCLVGLGKGFQKSLIHQLPIAKNK